MRGLVMALAVAAGMGALAPAAQAQTITVENVGFALPESIRYDAANDRYIVANHNGGFLPGFISIVTPDGKIENLKWIEGGQKGVNLDDARGTAILGDLLLVCDQTAVRMFDLRTGAAVGYTRIPGATGSLNDLVVAPDGTIYVTDTGGGAIWRRAPDGNLTRVYYEAAFRPNGINMDRAGNLVVLSMNDIVTMTPQGDIVRRLTVPGTGLAMPMAGLDGIVILPDGTQIVSALMGQAILRISTAGEIAVILPGVPSASAIGWDSKRNVLLIPQQGPNALRLVPMTATGMVR